MTYITYTSQQSTNEHYTVQWILKAADQTNILYVLGKSLQ